MAATQFRSPEQDAFELTHATFSIPRVSSNANTYTSLAPFLRPDPGRGTYNSTPRRQVNLHKIPPIVPRHIRREKPRTTLIPAKTTKFLRISIDNNPIHTSMLNTNSIISEALSRAEVEDPKQARSFEYKNFVLFRSSVRCMLVDYAASHISLLWSALYDRIR